VAVDENGTPKAGMGTAAADVDDDGDLDLLVVNLMGETDSLYRNEGGFFVDATAQARLTGASRGFTRFGVGFVDFDNDGWLDVYQANGRVTQRGARFDAADPYAEPSLLFRGTPEGRFEEVSPRGGTAPPLVATSRAAAFGDVDNDGGVDVLVANRDAPAYLLKNTAGARGHWVRLRVLEASGRDALGARVTATAGGRTFTREVHSAFSYQAASDPRVHLGLGNGAPVGAVVVRWPDGGEESFAVDCLDCDVTLRRGEGTGARP